MSDSERHVEQHPRSTTVGVRVSPPERRLITAAAGLEELSVSEFFRRTLLAAARSRVEQELEAV